MIGVYIFYQIINSGVIWMAVFNVGLEKYFLLNFFLFTIKLYIDKDDVTLKTYKRILLLVGFLYIKIHCIVICVNMFIIHIMSSFLRNYWRVRIICSPLMFLLSRTFKIMVKNLLNLSNFVKDKVKCSRSLFSNFYKDINSIVLPQTR